jgi:peroxiredoxin
VLVATGEAMFLAPPPKEEWLRSFLSRSYYPDLDRQIAAQLTGKPAPDFTLKNLAGQEVTLSKLIAGKVALVSFTACRCAGCRLEAPVLAKLYDQHRGNGLVVLAVNAWDEPVDLVRAYVEKEHLPYPFLLNGKSIWEQKYHLNTTPTSIWIDQEGLIARVHFGFEPGDEQSLQTEASQFLRARGHGGSSQR